MKKKRILHPNKQACNRYALQTVQQLDFKPNFNASVVQHSESATTSQIKGAFHSLHATITVLNIILHFLQHMPTQKYIFQAIFGKCVWEVYILLSFASFFQTNYCDLFYFDNILEIFFKKCHNFTWCCILWKLEVQKFKIQTICK